jgi:hypothetical protein
LVLVDTTLIRITGGPELIPHWWMIPGRGCFLEACITPKGCASYGRAW